MKYKVLRDFVSPYTTELFTEGSTIRDPMFNPKYENALASKGFIEEVKVDKRWRPREGDEHWYVRITDFNVRRTLTNPDDYDQDVFKSQETAEKVAEALKLFFSGLHDPETKGFIQQDLYNAYDTAREAVLADNKAEPKE